MIELRPYQYQAVSEVRGQFRAGKRRVLLVMPTGSGKCFAPGTMILMYDGHSKRVEDIVVGDRVMGPDGYPRTVTSLATGTEDMYRIVPTKGEPFEVNGSHILSLKMTTTREKERGEVVNISVNDYLSSTKWFRHLAKLWRSGVDFADPVFEHPMPPYMLGVWLGDGDSGNMSFTTGDAEIEAAIRAYAVTLGAGAREEPNSPNSKRLLLVQKLGNKGWAGRNGGKVNGVLRSLAVINNKHIPHNYKTGSRSCRLEVLAGLIDTDGYLSNGVYDLTLKSERLIDDAAFVARSLGFAAYKKPCQKTCVNNGKVGNYFRLCISGNIDRIPVRLARKKAAARRQKKDPLVTGFTVVPLGLGVYHGFELSGPDRLFLLSDFTVVHNTVCFAYITKSAIERGQQTIILAHRVELIEQISAALEAFDVPHSFIAAGYPYNKFARVHVASVQTLVRRLADVIAPTFIVCDEAHHCVAGNSWGKVVARWPDARILGVTATPVRTSGTGLGELFDCLVEGPTVRSLTVAGYLAPFRLYGPATVNADGLHIRAGEFIQSEVAALMDKPSIVGDVISHYRKLADGKQTILFTYSVEHSKQVAAEFRAAGYRFEHIDGTFTREARESRFNAFKAKAITGLCNVDLFGEGVDAPGIECGIFLRPTASMGLHLQQIGRCLRPAPGKDHAILIDHCGNTQRHGFPDDEREWSLEGREKGKRAAPGKISVRICPQCLAANRSARASCVACGHAFPVEAREVTQVDGELVELQRREARREQGTARTLEQLIEIGRARGYANPGYWAKRVFEGRRRA